MAAVAAYSSICAQPAEFKARFELGRLLGKGGFGSVFSCQERSSGRVFACKILDKERVLQRIGVQPCKEVSIMQQLANKHYGVVQLVECVEDDKHSCIVMEYCAGGTLLDVLKKNGAMPESSARHVLGQIAAALAFCHSKRIAHLDIKPENIFFVDPVEDALFRNLSRYDCNAPLSLASLQSSLDVRARLADFGMSTVLKPGKKVRGDVGSCHFKAPEIVAGNKFGLEVDVWSLGVVLCVMLTGAVPFNGSSNFDVAGINRAILQGHIDFDLPRWDFVSELGKDLLRRMLETNPAQRITAAEVLEHPWFNIGSPCSAPDEASLPDILPSFAAQFPGHLQGPAQAGKSASVRVARATLTPAVVVQKAARPLVTKRFNVSPWKPTLLKSVLGPQGSVFPELAGRLAVM